MLGFLKKYPEAKHYWRNRELGDIFGKHDRRVFASNPLRESIVVSYHHHVKGLAGTDSSKDFTQAYSDKYDLNFDGCIPTLVCSGENIPVYDFVIAPQVLNNASKNMSMGWWQSLIDAIHKDFPACSICVVGKSSIPLDNDLREIEHDIERFKQSEFLKANTTKYLYDVDYFWDRPLTEVAGLINTTGLAFICSDSGLMWINSIIQTPQLCITDVPVRCITSSYSNKDVRHETSFSPTIDDAMRILKEML